MEKYKGEKWIKLDHSFLRFHNCVCVCVSGGDICSKVGEEQFQYEKSEMKLWLFIMQK